MTKEIAIHNLYALRQRSRVLSDNIALDMAIKALEQQPILDKIRAEIMSKDGLEEALEIIDKYKAESEE